MDIYKYNQLLDGLSAFNERCGKPHGNEIGSSPTTDTELPFTQFSEARNVQAKGYNNRFSRVASVGYRVDIYATDKGAKYPKMQIARDISKMVDAFLSNEGLLRESFNAIDGENEGEIYHIIMMYSGYLLEYRQSFI